MFMARQPRDDSFMTLTFRGRVLLLAAIFFTFATLGPLFTLGRTKIESEP